MWHCRTPVRRPVLTRSIKRLQLGLRSQLASVGNTSFPAEPWLLPKADNILLERSLIRDKIEFLSAFGKSSSR